MPTLKYLPDAGAVYAGKNQPVLLTFSLVSGSEGLFCINGASNVASIMSYTIRNLQLMDVYSMLDAPRVEML